MSKNYNIYVIGPSTEDTGNWVHYYGSTNRWTYGENIPIMPNPTTGLISLLGPKNRFSNGYTVIDFLSHDLDLSLHNSCDIDSIVSLGKNNIVNFAISGSTVNGNIWNTEPDKDFNQIVGDHGYNSQVDKLVDILNRDNISLDKEDIILYTSLAGNDLGRIAMLPENEIKNGIKDFVSIHLDNIMKLYKAGCKKLIVTCVDVDAVEYSISSHKAEVVMPGLINKLKKLTDLLFNGEYGLTTQINNISKTLLDLDIVMIPLSILAKEWTENPEKYGLRQINANDVDIRVMLGTKDKPEYPFPSYYDTLMTHGVVADNTFYYDDNHLTEKMYRNNADIYTYIVTKRWLNISDV